MNLHDQSNPLMALGFTEIETQVYLSLLREAPVTGYRLAQGLGKPAANIYKALESLERKGAVIVEEGTHRLARPVPPANFLRQMDRSYRRLRRKAEKRLTET